MNVKKGSAELFTIIIAIVVIGSLTLGIVAFMGNSVKDSQSKNMDKTMEFATSAIKS